MTEKEHLEKIKQLVDLQARNARIWLIKPTTVFEAFLQSELRLLHGVIECHSACYIEDKIKYYED